MSAPARDPRLELLRQLADPVRLRVVDRLGHSGAATVSQLATELELALPQLSNHLRRLRDAGLVDVERRGRHAVYALADPGLEQLLPLLDRITGRIAAPPPADASDHARARTCYGHLAGRLGVEVYRALGRHAAVAPRADGTVALGPRAREVLGGLGVDPGAVVARRRRFAFECLDATQHAPHLAGALGDAVAEALARRRWVRPLAGGRALEILPAGRRGLEQTLGVRVG